MSTDPNRNGDMAEQWVALLASWKGAEVYRNINCTGQTDLVIKVDGVLYELDVKIGRPQANANGWRINGYTVTDPVIPVMVIPCGDICDWKVRWIRDRHPPELTDFWHKQPIHSTLDGNQIEDRIRSNQVPIPSEIQTHSSRQWDSLSSEGNPQAATGAG